MFFLFFDLGQAREAESGKPSTARGRSGSHRRDPRARRRPLAVTRRRARELPVDPLAGSVNLNSQHISSYDVAACESLKSA